MRITVTRAVGGVLGLACLAWLGRGAARTLYFDERAQLEASIVKAEGSLAAIERDRVDRPRIEASVQSYADRTLGDRWEVVDSALRGRLNDLGREAGLEAVHVNSEGPAPQPTPARRAFRSRGERALRDEPDFHEVEGRLSGEGTLEQVLRFVDRLQAEPWLKRIDQVRLDEKDGGQRIALTVRLTTLYVHGFAPRGPLPPSEQPRESERAVAIAAADPFRMHEAAPAPPAPLAEPEPKPKPAFPYGDWAVTGVVEGPEGPEVWLSNRSSGDVRRLAIGQSISQIVLAATSGDVAEFRQGPSRFRVTVGQTLADRQAVP